MTQKQQVERLREFREGDINVLVATSVGEEGLDVPAADLVLMYEPVQVQSDQYNAEEGLHDRVLELLKLW